ncbi:MAG: NAD(+) diphosphatase [Granulosicoccus sp.]
MFYCYSSLDRADHLRKHKDELHRLRHKNDSLLVPVWRDETLTSTRQGSSTTEALLLPGTALSEFATVFLGRDETQHYFAVDISSMDEPERDDLIGLARTRSGKTLPAEFHDLRSTGPLLSQDDGSLLAYARGLIYWNANTRFCYRCGTALEHHYHGHQRQCANQDCGYTLFPRTDPAVIMLVTYTATDSAESLCLLGRSPNWPEGVFSTLAGFVEPGETLEMAVRREVLEESSIIVSDVHYVASQPWPFPRSIMLGFEAIATSTQIRCDPHELDDAQWFTREQILSFGNWGDESEGYKLPRKDSIARHLIDRWVQRGGSSVV